MPVPPGPRPHTPLATLALAGGTLAAYAAELAAGGLPACEAYGLVPARFVGGGGLAPLWTSLLVHDPAGLAHVGLNTAMLAVFGALVERAIGGPALLGLYGLAGAAGGLLHVAVAPASTVPLVGASGAVFGLLAVAATLRPRLAVFAVALGGVEVWHALTGGAGAVSFGAHLGGLAAGVAVAAALRAAGRAG